MKVGSLFTGAGALLNYSTKIPPSQTAMEILGLLAAHGARSITLLTDGAGSTAGISFAVLVGGIDRPFRLPVKTAPVWEVLRRQYQQGKLRTGGLPNEAQAQRVAWRILKDWVEAQLALIETGMVRLEEVFLPYLLVGEDRTLFDEVRDREFLALPEPEESKT